MERLRDGGELRLYPEFLDPGEAVALFTGLRRSIPWKQEQVTVWGTTRPQRRLTAWYADPGCSYAYSQLSLEPNAWSPELEQLRARLDRELGHPFNSVLANLYRDGSDSMGWHSDNEACFARDPVVASVSLGAPRRFVLKHRASGERTEVLLGDGSLHDMAGTTQRLWKNSVHRTARPVGERINLTFRQYVRKPRHG